MLPKISFLTAVSCFAIGVMTCASAQEASSTDEEWNPPSVGPIITWTAPLCEKGKFAIQPFFFYNITRGAFNDEGHYKSLPDGNNKYQYQQQLLIEYGITDRLEIDAQAVYQENYAKEGELKAHDNGFGDSLLLLRYCTVKEKEWLPEVTGMLQLKIPTGKYQHADPNKLGTDLMGATSGGGSWDPGLGLILTKRIKPFIFHADAVYNWSQRVRVDGVNTRYADYLNLDVGVEYFLPKGFNILLEANNFLQGDRREDGAKIPSTDIKYLVISPGIGWSNDKIQTLLAYQRIVIGKNTDATDSVVLTCVYSF